MKKFYIVRMGAENSASRFIFCFPTYEDAEKMRDYLDKGCGASRTPSEIYEQTLYDSFDEAVGK